MSEACNINGPFMLHLMPMRFLFIGLQALVFLSTACFANPDALPYELASIFFTLESCFQAAKGDSDYLDKHIIPKEPMSVVKLLMDGLRNEATGKINMLEGPKLMGYLANNLLNAPFPGEIPGAWDDSSADINDKVTEDFTNWVLNAKNGKPQNTAVSVFKLYQLNDFNTGFGRGFRDLISNMATINSNLASEEANLEPSLKKGINIGNYKAAIKQIAEFRFEDWIGHIPATVTASRATFSVFKSKNRRTRDTPEVIKERVLAVAKWANVENDPKTKNFSDYVKEFKELRLKPVELKSPTTDRGLYHFVGTAEGAGHVSLLDTYADAYRTLGMVDC